MPGAMEEYYLLACPHGSPHLLCDITQDCLLRNGTAHSGLGPLISTVNEENAHRHLRRPSAEAIPPLRSLPPGDASLYQVDKN